ncbi:MAG: N-acetylneuraminic acid synthase [Deltaproteobacteria bacterium]|nr:N-acetylneuraminic acid synthase [Deltaproteobacteria bacterium]
MHSDRNTQAEETSYLSDPSPTAPRFVAEVSSNHQCDLDRALRFVDRAAEIGCDGVKFQLFRIDELFAPEILRQSATHRARRRWELPERFLAPIAQRCQDRGIAFGCTPFYLDAVNALSPFVDFLKIASYELLWDDLLVACAQTGLPLVLSTGMATLDEVAHAARVIERAGGRHLTLLHCVSGYPAPAAEANLAAIDRLAALHEGFDGLRVRSGWSDHTVEPGVIYRAAHAHPTEMIEFHLDLEGEGDEFESGHCWLPDDIQETIAQVRTGFRAEGHGDKRPSDVESEERSWRADPSDGLRPLRSLRHQWSPLAR